MSRIRQSSIETLRERVDICDVVSVYVNLRRCGAYYRGLSPFNEERTPSFFVHPERKIFKCYSSGKAGDVFSFLQQKEQMTFPEVVEFLAQRYAVPLEYEDDSNPIHTDEIPKSVLLSVHERAGVIFREYFLSATQAGHVARVYWTQERKFSLSGAESYGIGLAPTAISDIMIPLLHAYSPEILVKSGLFYCKESSSELIFRFRGRLMIPIHDVQGRIVAFSGRILPAASDDNSAKYINSPETPLFHKSSLLFGLYRARTAVEKIGSFLLTEGPLDCLRCWECGLPTAVAAQGTGVTLKHLALLRRYAVEMECLLDGDQAGQKAALRIIPLAFKAGINVRFLPLPAATDPDVFFLQFGVAGLDALRKNSLSPVEFLVQEYWNPVQKASYAHRQEALRKILSAIAEAESQTAELDLLHQLTALTGIPLGTLRADCQPQSFVAKFFDDIVKAERTQPPAFFMAGEFLLYTFIFFERWRPVLAAVICPEWLSQDIPAERLLNLLIGEWENGTNPDDALATLAESDRDYVCGLSFSDLPDGEENLAPQLEQCVQRLHRHWIERELAKISGEIGPAQARQRAILRKQLMQPPKLDHEWK
ncbi:MAG: DNA primase [Puniceicoccales bacterium]|jgi:DNA primase|nr:DNA primase [Puniceicoccales bacterium]